jgi:hypothetical protein
MRERAATLVVGILVILLVAAAFAAVVIFVTDEEVVTFDCGKATLRVEGDEAGELGLEESDLRRLCVESLQRRHLIPDA